MGGQLAVALGSSPDRMGGVQTFDPRDPVVDELGPVARRCWDGGGSERIERGQDQVRAALTGARTQRNELMMRALLHQSGGAGEGATHRWLAIATIAETGNEVATGAQGMPATKRDERARSRVTRPGDDAGVVVTPPAVGALTASVAAVQLRTARTARAVRGTIAHRAPPRLHNVVGEIGERTDGFNDVHEWSVIGGCDTAAPAAGRSAVRRTERSARYRTTFGTFAIAEGNPSVAPAFKSS